MTRVPVAAVVVLFCASAPGGAQSGAQSAGGAGRGGRGGPPPDVPILVRDVAVIDGTGASARAHMDVVVRGGKLAAIVPTGSAPAPVPDSVIDGRGMYAIPGLIDAHVHTGQDPWDKRAADLRGALMGGVTSVLELAGDTRATGDLQRAVLAGQIPGPHIRYVALFGGPAFFTDPRVLDASRGYVAGTAPWMQSVTAETDFVRAIAMAKGTGAMGIKLYAALDSATVVRATAEAHRQGLKVIAHATTFPARPADLVGAGVDMLAHTPYLVWQGSERSTDFPARARGDFVGVPANSPVIDATLRAMQAHGTALNPTLWVFGSQPPDSVSRVRTPWMNAVTHRAQELGVRIVAGTDGLYAPRVDSLPLLHRELELLVTGAGLTPLQAITAATRNAAWAAGIDSVTGTLAAGMNADLVLLGADPTADIRATRALRMVMQDGRVVMSKAAGPQWPADWLEPFPPFRIVDNLYYVGTKGLANYLITTPQGHILINSDLEANVPAIKASVEALGFRFADIRILLISHAHWDHDAGSALVTRMTGARYMVMDADVPVVESGGAADFHYGADLSLRYPPVKVDRVLHDGDTVALGGTTLVAHLTPGHTRGTTTWTMQVTDGGRRRDVVIVGSPNVNAGYKLAGNTAYPGIATDFERTFRVLASLPVDYFLGAHGSYFNLEGKYAKLGAGGESPFLDPAGYRAYVAAAEQAFHDKLASQQAGGKP